jgi:hypothetical protein
MNKMHLKSEYLTKIQGGKYKLWEWENTYEKYTAITRGSCKQYFQPPPTASSLRFASRCGSGIFWEHLGSNLALTHFLACEVSIWSKKSEKY